MNKAFQKEGERLKDDIKKNWGLPSLTTNPQLLSPQTVRGVIILYLGTDDTDLHGFSAFCFYP